MLMIWYVPSWSPSADASSFSAAGPSVATTTAWVEISSPLAVVTTPGRRSITGVSRCTVIFLEDEVKDVEVEEEDEEDV